MPAPVRILMAAIALALSTVAASAQTIIRDAEIERALAALASPILQAAGLPGSTRIMVLRDSDMNAFVVDARHIFLNSGLILRLDNVAELQGVIAHEAAHIANGHLTRRAGNMGAASTAARLGMLLAVATAAATGETAAAVGLAAGTSSSAMRLLFAHTRAEEASADQSGLRYMAQAGADPAAMLEVLDLFRGQEALSVGRQDPYVRTHPLTRDRLRSVRAFVAGQDGTYEPDATVAYWYARLTAKLSAFLNAPSWTLRRVRDSDTGEIATLRRAIAYHRMPDADQALREIGRLLEMRPNDPYYQELQGQILFESRHFPQAVQAYARAVELAPREALILAGYGQALLAADTAQDNARALEVLSRARDRDPHDPRMLRDLALAHARAGQNGMASVATAERYAILGRMEDAQIHANRAAGLLPQGSSGWLRAQDVLSVAQAAENRRER